MSAVELNGVSKHYGEVRAVDNINLTLESGEFLTLLGPSGCGKTTTLRMVAGFVQPTAGTVKIGSQDVTGIAPHRRQVGLVFQNYALFPHMTVADNVAFGLKMRKVAVDERQTRVTEALDLVQLGSFGGRFPAQLSGGQQQRVALARALVIRPEVLLLDEPFGALDKQLRDHMRVELRALQQQLGISTVFVTHDQEEAMAMSDRICMMESGIIRQLGTPSSIYEQPTNRFVANFMGRSNLLDATIDGVDGEDLVLTARGLELRSRQTDMKDAAAPLVMVRPERIVLTAAGQDGAGLEGDATTGKVSNAIYLGSLMHYEIRLPNAVTLLATAQIDSDFARRHFNIGESVAVTIPREAVYVLDST